MTWQVPSRAPASHALGGVLTYRNVYLLTENYDVWTPQSDATTTEIIVLPRGVRDFSPDVNETFDATVRVFRDPEMAMHESGETTSQGVLAPFTTSQLAAMTPYPALNLTGCVVRHAQGVSEESTLVAHCADAHTIVDIRVESLDEYHSPHGDITRAERVLQDIHTALTQTPEATLTANTQWCTKDSECFEYHVDEQDVCVTRLANVYADITDYESSFLPTLCPSDYTKPRCLANTCTQTPNCAHLLRGDGWNKTCAPEHLREVHGSTGDERHPGDLTAACAAYAQCVTARR
jgi:hypothetical protein